MEEYPAQVSGRANELKQNVEHLRKVIAMLDQVLRTRGSGRGATRPEADRGKLTNRHKMLMLDVFKSGRSKKVIKVTALPLLSL